MRTLEVHVLDVGTADAILIVYQDREYRHVTLIDCATAKHVDALVNACWLYAGGVIDLLVLSHPDGDHVGGVRELLQRVLVREVMSDDPQLVFGAFGSRLEKADTRIRERIDCLRTGAEVVRHIRTTRRVWTPLPGFRPAPHLVVLGPTSAFWGACMSGQVPLRLDLGFPPFTRSLDSEIDVSDDDSPINQSSVVLGVEFDGLRFVFPGDAGQAALIDVCQNWTGMNDLFWLQLPHHGSRHSLSSGLIRRLRPTVAGVSAAPCDADHPHPGIVRALNAVGTQVYGTRGSELAWWSDGVRRPGFGSPRVIAAPPRLPSLGSLLLGPTIGR